MSKDGFIQAARHGIALVDDLVCRMRKGGQMADAMQGEMLDSARSFATELVDTVLASAPEVIPNADAAAHAAVLAHAIHDTAERMRDGGLGDALIAIWLEASVTEVRHRLELRTGPRGPRTTH
jgi:hypothetical protein